MQTMDGGPLIPETKGQKERIKKKESNKNVKLCRKHIHSHAYFLTKTNTFKMYNLGYIENSGSEPEVIEERV